MYSYILKRLLLIIPTLFGIITINFFIIQLAPGGPVEEMMHRLDSLGATTEIARTNSKIGSYDHHLDAEALEHIKKLYGFDKPIFQRYLLMLKQYLTWDFGESYYRKIGVLDLLKEKMPVSLSLGIFSTLLIYLLGIPLGIYKAYRDGNGWDVLSSVVIVMANAIPTFLFAILLIVLFASGNYWDLFPLKGLVSEGFENLSWWEKIKDYLWHISLPVIALSIGGFATLVLLVKNSFLDEMQKYYVTYAKIKGERMQNILYFYVFRNAMLLVISSFPMVFLGMFFSGSLLVEIIFSLDGLGLLGYDSLLHRDYPVVFGSLYLFTLLGLIASLMSDLLYVVIDPRINFDKGER